MQKKQYQGSITEYYKSNRNKMFRKLFDFSRPAKSTEYEVGKQLFHQGMQAAYERRTADAIELYSKSFSIHANPAPLINRAKLYRLRLLFDDAIRDLELAHSLDKKQSNEFSFQIEKELIECKFLAHHRISGMNKMFIDDLRKKGFDYASSRILDSVFEGNGLLLAHHLIDELDNIRKFENLRDFPSAKTLLDNWMKDQKFMNATLGKSLENEEYLKKRNIFQSLVCSYDYADMAKMRDTIVRKIWCATTSPGQMQALWEVSLRNQS